MLWKDLISLLYGEDGGFFRPTSVSGTVWGGVINAYKKLKDMNIDIYQGIRRKIGDGVATKFWIDPWLLSGSRLMDRFPRLYALELDRLCSVADRCNSLASSLGFSFNWRVPPRGRTLEELQELSSLLHNVRLLHGRCDGWTFSLLGQKSFSPNSICKQIAKCLPSNLDFQVSKFWLSWIPGKVNIFIWRALMDRLPSKANLTRRGVQLQNDACILCGSGPEMLAHTLFQCPKVGLVWKKIYAWWGITFPSLLGWDGPFLAPRNLAAASKGEKLKLGVGYVALWHIWNWRNKSTFATGDDVVTCRDIDIFPRIQFSSFLWLSTRGKFGHSAWNLWLVNPIEIADM